MTSYFRDNRDRLREYNQRREGHRPLRSFTCRHCGQPTRAYVDGELCHRCRGLVEPYRYV
jgi:hypothetical protein